MTTLANVAVAGAVTAQVTPAVQMRDGSPETMAFQANFTYGSGGSTVASWVQTSFDDGVTWCDVASFAFTTSSARSIQNVSALLAVATPLAATDGSLASNTSQGGVLGPLWRVKYTTTGTYAGGTTLRIDAAPNRGRLTLR